MNISLHSKWLTKEQQVLLGAILLLMLSLFSSFPAYAQPDPVRSDSATNLTQEFYTTDQDEIYVIVNDADENEDPSGIDSIQVLVSVWRQMDSERLTLTETGSATGGVFTNKAGLALSSAPSPQNDNRLYATSGQVIEVTYVDDDDPTDQSGDQAFVEGGVFSYTIDPNLTPSRDHVMGEPTRPIVVVMNPGGSRDEFVVNELIVAATDQQVIDDILATYAGSLLHDGELPAPHPDTPQNRVRQIPSNSGYRLIRVDPTEADLTNLEERMTAYGLYGEFLFSSKEALQLGVILLDQREQQRNVFLNMTVTPDRCPTCQSTQEDPAELIAYQDAFNPLGYPWFDTSWVTSGRRDLYRGADVFGVTKAWQFLDALGLPDAPNRWQDIWEYNTGTRPDWERVRFGIIDAGFAPNGDWEHDHIEDYECELFGYTPVLRTMNTCLDCCDRVGYESVPWHGTIIHNVATAHCDNRYGAAGIAGLCGGPILEPVFRYDEETFYGVSENVRSLVRAGVDVINMSFGRECNWWCDLWGWTWASGKDALADALSLARDEGVILVAAAGNAGRNLGSRLYLPCEGPGVICVGAVEHSTGTFEAVRKGLHDKPWTSNFGAGIDIWAPTDIFVSTWDLTDTSYPPSLYVAGEASGTSSSSPYVAAIFSMIKALYPPAERDSFDAGVAQALLSSTAWITEAVSHDVRVREYGGLIHPYAMLQTQAATLGIHEVNVDANEPNNSSSEADTIELNTSISGIVAPLGDEDWFSIDVDEYWDLTAHITSGTDLDHLDIDLFQGSTLVGSSSSSPAGPTLLASVEPGTYYIRVTGPGSSELFNCYELQVTAVPSYIAPDIFDDGLADTPSGGPWPRERNDSSPFRTELNWPAIQSPGLIARSYRSLNIDRLNGYDDWDFFQVTLPEDADSCRCETGSDSYSSKLRIGIVESGTSAEQLQILIGSPDGGPPIDPYAERWVRWARERGYTGRIIEIECPQEATSSDGRRIANAEGEIYFWIEPQSTRAFYDLDIAYEFLPDDHCAGSIAPWHVDAFLPPLMEEPLYSSYPTLKPFWDCLADPGCDPPSMHLGVNWVGDTDFEALFQYASPAEQGEFQVSLIDNKGDVLGTGQPFESTEIGAASFRGIPPPKARWYSSFRNWMQVGTTYRSMVLFLPSSYFKWAYKTRIMTASLIF